MITFDSYDELRAWFAKATVEEVIALIVEMREADYSGDDTHEWELCELASLRHDQQLAEIPHPDCCEAQQKWPTVYMHLHFDGHKDRYVGEPYWSAAKVERVRDGYKAPEPWCCPYCGTRLPKFVKRTDELPQPMMDHDGYHCRTCGERPDVCACHPFHVAWRLEKRQ